MTVTSGRVTGDLSIWQLINLVSSLKIFRRLNVCKIKNRNNTAEYKKDVYVIMSNFKRARASATKAGGRYISVKCRNDFVKCNLLLSFETSRRPFVQSNIYTAKPLAEELYSALNIVHLEDFNHRQRIFLLDNSSLTWLICRTQD